MKVWWCFICLGLALAPMVLSNADDQKSSVKTWYQYAIEALRNNDCKAAIIYLEKYKAEAAAQLSKYPDFARMIDLQISECRDATTPVNVRLIAGADTDPGIATATPAADLVLTAASSAVGGVLLLILIILLLF